MTHSTIHRSTLLTILFALVASCAIAKPPGIAANIVNYGIFTFSDPHLIIKTPETTSGVTQVPAGKPVLIAATNRIPAKIGIRFGLTYYVVNIPVTNGYVEITKVAKHPTIQKPDGKSSTGYTTTEKQFVKDGHLVGWTGYGFDHDYELAPGQWEFAVMFEGQPLCKQQFTIFAP